MKERNLAAIDLGTNSFHLIIVKVKPDGSFESLGKEKEVVRLGSGVEKADVITPEAFERGIACLKRFKALAEVQDAEIRAIATSALREAKNREQFLERAEKEIGISIEIISGYEEARLIYYGILLGLPVFSKRILMIDIGGGSTELLVGERGEILFAHSLKIGAVRLTDRFLYGDPNTTAQIQECKLYIEGMLSPYKREIERLKPEIVVGSSGTVQSIANMILAKKGEEPPRTLNSFVFTDKEFFEIREILNKADTLKKRTKIPGLDVRRADIIVAGSLVLEEIFKTFQLKSMTVSDFALREGIIYDTIQKWLENQTPYHPLVNIRSKAINSLFNSFPFEKEHVEQVTRLALEIFDQTKEIHKCSRQEREYLEAAAKLHEVGFGISHTSHHKHSYYIIRNSELMVGFNFEEIEIIALVARYHRKSPPKPKHTEFQSLSKKAQATVRKLASILRIADGLDRSHQSIVESIKCELQEKILFIKIKCKKELDPHIDIWSAQQKKDLFEETFALNVGFVVL